MKNKLMLIDANSLIYRAYHGSAYSKSGILKNSQGTPVNAILVFARMINNFIIKYNPTHLLVAFDAGKKTHRHNEFPEYKAGRAKTPEDLIPQFKLIKKMLNHMNIKHYEKDGIEADDIIGTSTKKFKKFAEISIISSDKDMFQLIDKNIYVIFPQNGNKDNIIYDNSSFKEKIGYLPAQVIDIKGLEGDASDNLPGVRGIGHKGAIKLITDYNNLENIYANISNISGSIKEKLIANEKAARLSKKLATIDKNVPLELDFENFSWSFKKIDHSLIDFFKKLEINSLIKKFEKHIEKKEISDTIFF